MGGAPNHRAFCSQASGFAFLDREEGCHQLCGFRFLARKCKNRPLPPGGRTGQTGQKKIEMKTSPPQDLCGTDRRLPQFHPRPLNLVGARPRRAPPGRGRGCLHLRGLPQLMLRPSDQGGPPGEEPELQTPTAPVERAGSRPSTPSPPAARRPRTLQSCWPWESSSKG